MGNGMPFPHSGSFSSRLFLFTILAGAACPAAAAAAAAAAVLRCPASSAHDMIGFVLRKMAASVGGNRERWEMRERERGGGREVESRGWGWKEKETAL